MSNAPAVRALVAFFEGLCPEAVARFPEYYASDAYFNLNSSVNPRQVRDLGEPQA